MCGIVGSIQRAELTNLSSALRAMAHRGPDASQQWSEVLDGVAITLGHARLSILDLTAAANQPFHSADGRYVIVFNGEIYNHAELRERLSARGVRCRTRSDTEVLLAAFIEWGLDCLPMLDGMFAFAVLDRARRELFAARDFFGIKPFYYCTADNGGFAFASEIRALEAAVGRRFRPDADSYAEFLLNGFLYEPNTGLTGVMKLPPAGWLRLNIATNRVEQGLHGDPLSDRPAGEGGIERLLRRSMELQVEADVPVGVFFSGGIDSTVLLAEAPHPVQAVFVDYSAETHHADREFAERAAHELGVPLCIVSHAPALTDGADSILAEFAGVARGTEEPISDYTYAATELLSKVAREQGLKVMLSGMGGDELFAGYPRYVAARHWNMLRLASPLLPVAHAVLKSKAAWSKRIDRLSSFADAQGFVQAYTQLVGYFSTTEVARLLGREAGVESFFERLDSIDRPARRLSLLKRSMHLDRFGFLAHNLCVTDRASMAHGLEVRVPLMTREIAGWAFHADDRDLLVRGVGKKPLKDVLSRRVSRQIRERPKVGFNPPIDGKIAVIGQSRLLDLLVCGRLRGVMDTSLVAQWIDEHFSQRRNHSYRLWQLCYFAMWLEEHEC
jgi:asparagine synthase (glutamine-hydrolysing)